MRLAIICRPFSFHGGVETATAGLLGELIRRGHRIDLVSTRAQPDVPGATVRRLLAPDQPSVLRLLCFALAARRAVAVSTPPWNENGRQMIASLMRANRP